METSDVMSRIYYDPVDEPRVGSAVMITSSEDRRRRWRANSVESCLRAFLEGQSGENYLFRRVDPKSAYLSVWEIPEPERKDQLITGVPGRLLGCYDCISSFRRTVRISPELAERYGVQEVYLLSDEIAEHFSYLDRTGKIRPLRLIVDGSAVEPDADEAFLREEVEHAIPYTLEAVYPIVPIK